MAASRRILAVMDSLSPIDPNVHDFGSELRSLTAPSEKFSLSRYLDHGPEFLAKLILAVSSRSSEMFASPAWLLVRSHYSMDCEASTVKTASHLVPSILNGTFFSSGMAALRNCKALGGL